MLTYRAINNTNIRHAGRDTTAAMQGSTIYKRVKPAKLLPHTAHSDESTAPAELSSDLIIIIIIIITIIVITTG